jgi:hypothetical protein
MDSERDETSVSMVYTMMVEMLKEFKWKRVNKIQGNMEKQLAQEGTETIKQTERKYLIDIKED